MERTLRVDAEKIREEIYKHFSNANNYSDDIETSDMCFKNAEKIIHDNSKYVSLRKPISKEDNIKEIEKLELELNKWIKKKNYLMQSENVDFYLVED